MEAFFGMMDNTNVNINNGCGHQTGDVDVDDDDDQPTECTEYLLSMILGTMCITASPITNRTT